MILYDSNDDELGFWSDGRGTNRRVGMYDIGGGLKFDTHIRCLMAIGDLDYVLAYIHRAHSFMLHLFYQALIILNAAAADQQTCACPPASLFSIP